MPFARRTVVIAGLIIGTLLIPWHPGHAPATSAIKPAPVAAGQTATVSTKVQARVAGTVAVEVTARNAHEQVVWKKTWPTETFGRWQSRSYTADWAVPATQPG